MALCNLRPVSRVTSHTVCETVRNGEYDVSAKQQTGCPQHRLRSEYPHPHATHLYEHFQGLLRGALLADVERVHDALHHGPRCGLELVPVRRLVQVLCSSDVLELMLAWDAYSSL